jgi:putative DNA primase/helicase
MGDSVDIKELKQQADIVQVIKRYINLKPDGDGEWKGLCCFHNEKTPSFSVSEKKKIFKCFGCNEGGDVIDFLVATGLTFQDALKEISDPNNTSATPLVSKNNASKKTEKVVNWRQIIPAYNKEGMFHHYKHGMPSQTWPYYTKEGALMGYTCRFDLPDGKQVLPLVYSTDGTRTLWRYGGFDKPRPLRNLNQLAEHNNSLPIIIFEGEKTSKSAEKFFVSEVCTNWIGGTAGVKSTDWKPLFNKNVILWPDNDQPGFDAMHEVYQQLKEVAFSVKWVVNPPLADKGWDVADADWDMQTAIDYLRNNTIEYPGETYKYKTEEEAVLEVVHSVMQQKEEKGKKKAVLKKRGGDDDEAPPEKTYTAYRLKENPFFRMLGVQKEGNGMVYFFYAFATKTVICLTPSGMTKNNLMQLAPLDWWENEFPDKKYAFSVEEAVNYLISKSSEFGIFSYKRLRGRGAWIDDKRVVIHAGSRLLVDGKAKDLSKFKSKYIYEFAEDLDFTLESPLPKTESYKLIKLVELLSWERPINAYLFLGWCVVAPVCGALEWRPHVWLTGGAGTGKSTILKNVARPLLGEAGLAVQGETSEAGLRQLLANDALPVIFDEAEGGDRKAQERMQMVLSFMRASSHNDGGVLVKGSAGGSANTFRTASCFLFASIAVQIAKHADKTRVSILALMNPNKEVGKAKWKQFLSDYASFFNDDFCRGVRSRTISLLPTILANVKTFSMAVAAEIGEQRAGDQIGVLLAGAYSLTSDDVITYEKAVEFVKSKEWEEEKLEVENDEHRLLSFILEQMVRIETERGAVERTVGELVLYAMNLKTGGYALTDTHSQERLKRIGIRVDSKKALLFISNSDSNMLKLLASTNWSPNHNKILERLPGAFPVPSMRFSGPTGTRAVGIPKEVFYKYSVEDDIVPVPTTAIDMASEISKPVSDVFTQGEVNFES